MYIYICHPHLHACHVFILTVRTEQLANCFSQHAVMFKLKAALLMFTVCTYVCSLICLNCMILPIVHCIPLALLVSCSQACMQLSSNFHIFSFPTIFSVHTTYSILVRWQQCMTWCTDVYALSSFNFIGSCQ